MAKWWCWGCRKFVDFDEVFNDYDAVGYHKMCKTNIRGEVVN